MSIRLNYWQTLPIQSCYRNIRKIEAPLQNFVKFYFYELKKNSVKVKNSTKYQNKVKLFIKGYCYLYYHD